MVKTETYKYLSDYLSGVMEREYNASHKDWRSCKTLRGLGQRTKGYQTWVETVLTDLFERYLCLDKDKRVLVGEDGGTLYAYNGRYFERVDVKAEKFIGELVKRTMRALDIGSMYVQKCPADIAKSVVGTLTSSDEYLYIPDRRYVAFRNVIFDLPEGKVRQFSLKYRPYIVLDVDYNDYKAHYRDCADRFGISGNPCKLWETKIREIIPNNDARDAFQQFCGSLLIDRDSVRIEYICYLVGTGSNGKSVVASTIAGMFGEKYFSRFSLRQLFKDSDARVNIAALDGKICNLIGDLEKTEVAGGDFKRAVSGEKFQGRRNYKDPITVSFPPLLCCTNFLPESSDDSWGHHRRQLPIHTTSHQWTEEDKDPMLTHKLTTPEARLAVWHWVYEGYRKIMRNQGNIRLGEDVVRAQQILQDHSNSVRLWFSDSGYKVVDKPLRGDTRWRTLKDLYAEYKAYAESHGYDASPDSRDISGVIRSKGASRQNGNERRTADGIGFCIEKILDDKSNILL